MSELTILEWVLIGVASMSVALALILAVVHVFRLREAKRERENPKETFTQRQQREMRQHAQKDLQEIIDESASLVRTDVQKMTAAINEYMQKEVSRVLSKEIDTYKKSASSVKDAAVVAIEEARDAFIQKNSQIDKVVAERVAVEKESIINGLDEKIAGIIEQYVSVAMQDQVTVDSQIDAIIRQLEANKDAIVEDVRGVV